jgi:cell volume regulation protein A
MNAELLEVEVTAGSGMVGCYISELTLPRGADVALLVRDGRSGPPGAATRLKAGDRLLVVATADVRLVAERRLRAVSRRGPLAGWYGERGDPD